MQDSFEDYVTGRGRALLRFAYVLCHDADLAQDLVQNALVKTHARWNRVEAPNAYVHRAIINDFCSWKRRRRELVTGDVPEFSENDPGPEDRDAMWRLLAELPRQQRAVLVLRFYEGLADDAIGRALGRRDEPMNELESHLADLMTAHADRAPHDLGLLSRVQAASARRTRVRRYGALGLAVAAVAVAGVALGASVLTGGKPSADRFTDPTGFLVDGRGRVAQFPLTPGYLHPRLSDQVNLDPYDAAGRYGSATWRFPKVPGTGTPQDTISVLPTAPREFPRATSVRVNGLPGRQSGDCSTLTCTLTWQRGPAQVLQVYVLSSNGGAKEEAYKVAAGLVDRPIVVRQVLVLGLVPDADCTLQMPRSFSDGTASTSYVGKSPCGFGASLQPADAGPFPPGAEKVELGGRSGTLREDTRRITRNGKPATEPIWSASFPLDNGRVLLVSVPRDGGWTMQELDRFVRAIELPRG